MKRREEKRMGRPCKEDPARNCEQCGSPLVRKRLASNRLEDRTEFLGRRFCSRKCLAVFRTKERPASKASITKRTRRFRKSACERCGSETDLHVHHEDHDRFNNDPINLETVCSVCHGRQHAFERWSRRSAA
jgi:hypothetical protein